jgi:hypothetical protein
LSLIFLDHAPTSVSTIKKVTSVKEEDRDGTRFFNRFPRTRPARANPVAYAGRIFPSFFFGRRVRRHFGMRASPWRLNCRQSALVVVGTLHTVRARSCIKSCECYDRPEVDSYPGQELKID